MRDALSFRAGRVSAMARPNPLPVPHRQDVAALSKPDVYDRWNAGVRSAQPGSNVIEMFEVVGEDFWSGGGITAKGVKSQLRAIGDHPVEVQLNSPGGDMFEGIAIYNVLREHPQPVTIKVLSLAASAASIIAMAGDRVEISAAGFIMIHNCWVLAMGNQHDFRELADFLKPFDSAMVEVYAQRTGKTAAEIAAWMDAETYMGAAQAIERGFADALLPSDMVREDPDAKARSVEVNALRKLEIAACATMSRSDARALISKIKGTPGAAETGGTPGAASNDWAAEAATLLATLKS
jgi:ATP-dependent protease ClpP protease subunit